MEMAGSVAVRDRMVLPRAALTPDSSHALQSARSPGSGGPTTTTRRLSASIAGGHQGAVHGEHGVLAEPLARPEREQGTEMPDDAVGRRLRPAGHGRRPADGRAGDPLGPDSLRTVLAQSYINFLQDDMDGAAPAIGSVTGVRPDIASS
ncbi:hypothetical protein B446_00985 [Streptomyces collinus Tu 365]|uniref:Uncharacterized protein n=1 Tax=Streptomyces collinus (strain DSM 40733 / Tue 365) TaxID=1214242 RepID=S5VF17_STRC3|nr:hypothetical protein B446_00985 [Streptomyces collinus Tu 365]